MNENLVEKIDSNSYGHGHKEKYVGKSNIENKCYINQRKNVIEGKEEK